MYSELKYPAHITDCHGKNLRSKFLKEGGRKLGKTMQFFAVGESEIFEKDDGKKN